MVSDFERVNLESLIHFRKNKWYEWFVFTDKRTDEEV
jgi:hypothetical protein